MLIVIVVLFLCALLDITWTKARLADQAPTFVERQQELFFLTFRCALFMHKGEQYKGLFGDGTQVVEEILKFAVEEDLNRKDSDHGQPNWDELRGGMPFTALILSARGSQCDNVWNIAFKVRSSHPFPKCIPHHTS